MTLRRAIGIVVSAAILTACTPRTPEMQLIYDTGDILGGTDDFAEIETLILEGAGEQYYLGYSFRPDGNLPYWEVENYRREIDLVNVRWRVTQEQTSRFLTNDPMLRREQVFGLDGDVAYDVAEDGTVVRAVPHVAAQRVVDHYHHPAPLIRLAVSEGSTLSNLRQEGDQDVIDVTAPSGQSYTLYVDASTMYPTQIRSTAYHPVLGDVTLRTAFDDYWETGGLGGFGPRLTLPREINVYLDGDRVAHLRVTTDVDRDVDDLQAPEEAPAGPIPVADMKVPVQEVADGIWMLGGGTQHSVVVEFDEFLALVDPPEGETPTLAAIDAARQLRPEKPLQYVVNTHHHFDHVAGIRTVVSEGLTVITHARNEAFLRALVERPHTVRPDALARNPQPLNLELVEGGEVYALNSDRRTMNIALVPGNDHAAGMLMAYVPGERLLIEADAYIPGTDVAPFAPALLQAVTERGWRVDRIVPIHGAVVEIAALEQAAEDERTRR